MGLPIALILGWPCDRILDEVVHHAPLLAGRAFGVSIATRVDEAESGGHLKDGAAFGALCAHSDSTASLYYFLAPHH